MLTIFPFKINHIRLLWYICNKVHGVHIFHNIAFNQEWNENIISMYETIECMNEFTWRQFAYQCTVFPIILHAFQLQL